MTDKSSTVKYDTIKNPNYVATVIQVTTLEPLEGLDNLVALRAFGMQALVRKDSVRIGDVGILFSTEMQLSEEFARENNLHRHTNLNADPTVTTGYLEDNRRVKAIKLRGHRSDSLFLPLTSLAYLGVEPEDFEVGDVFDSINGREVCRKYVIREPAENKGPQAKVRRVDVKNFPMHIDSENWWRNEHKIPDMAHVTITQKLHGTSARFGKVLVERDLKWYERLAQRLGVKVQTHEYKFVVGSRMVVKSIDGEAESAGKEHYYAEDLWSEYAARNALDKVIPPGFLVYGEIVGYTYEGGAIQKGYTYDLNPDNRANELYVYRVATIVEGRVTDLSWEEVKRFCKDAGLKWVPEMCVVYKKQAMSLVDTAMDRCYYEEYLNPPTVSLSWADVPVPLSDKGTVDEGVCVRWDGPNGVYILKAKAPIFLGHETKLLDQGDQDIESAEGSDATDS